MTRPARLRYIRRVMAYREYLAAMPDPGSLARLPTAAEREELAQLADQAGTRAGAAWVARQRGIR